MPRRKRLSAAYTPEEPPARGAARKIWRALEDAGLGPIRLCYGAGRWACEIRCGEYLCGWDGASGRAYIRELCAPYAAVWVDARG